MKHKKQRPEYANYVVAFLDVLGQRAAFKPLEKFPIIEQSDEFKEALESIHVDTVHNVKTLREAFVGLFNDITAERPIPKGIPQDKVEVFKEMRKTNLKYKSFSDCMQFFACLNTDKFHCQAMNAVQTMFTATGGLLLATLAERKVFRAGIDVGIGIEIEEDEVYGQALFRAYDLESKIAKYPRIVIGDTLINYLRNLAHQNPQIPNQSSEDIALCKTMAEYCLKSLKQDIDGYIMLDYLGENFSIGLKEALEEKFQLYFDLAFDFIQSEYMRFKKAKDSQMAQRYHWLYQYFLEYKARNPSAKV